MNHPTQQNQDYKDYTYNNRCVECGRTFESTDMYVRICAKCLNRLGLHIEEEDNDDY